MTQLDIQTKVELNKGQLVSRCNQERPAAKAGRDIGTQTHDGQNKYGFGNTDSGTRKGNNQEGVELMRRRNSNEMGANSQGGRAELSSMSQV